MTRRGGGLGWAGLGVRGGCAACSCRMPALAAARWRGDTEFCAGLWHTHLACCDLHVKCTQHCLLVLQAAVLREIAAKGLRPQMGPGTPILPQLRPPAPYNFAAPPPPPPGYRPPQLGSAPLFAPPPGFSRGLPRPPPPSSAVPAATAADVGAVPMSSRQLAEFLASAAQLEDEDAPEWALCPITQARR